jgi:hypothetical protein
MVFVALKWIRTQGRPRKAGRWRFHNQYRLPCEYGGGQVSVRLHGSAEDVRAD